MRASGKVESPRDAGETDFDFLDRVTDEEIAAAVAEDPDAVPIGLDWSKAKIFLPQPKAALSIRIDADVLDFFRGQGRGYQTRINAVLRSYMEHARGKTRA